MITKFNTDRNTFHESQKRELITIKNKMYTACLMRLRHPDQMKHIGVHRYFSADSFSSRLSQGAAAGLGNNITAIYPSSSAASAGSSIVKSNNSKVMIFSSLYTYPLLLP